MSLVAYRITLACGSNWHELAVLMVDHCQQLSHVFLYVKECSSNIGFIRVAAEKWLKSSSFSYPIFFLKSNLDGWQPIHILETLQYFIVYPPSFQLGVVERILAFCCSRLTLPLLLLNHAGIVAPVHISRSKTASPAKCHGSVLLPPFQTRRLCYCSRFYLAMAMHTILRSRNNPVDKSLALLYIRFFLPPLELAASL